MLKFRELGSSGIRISEIGFGTWGIGGDTNQSMAYGPSDDDISVEALETAFDMGVNFYDTSNLYGWGHSERLLGATFSGRRNQVVIATKAGFVDQNGKQDFSADSVSRSLDESLERLQTGYVDVFQLHSPERQALENNSALRRLVEKLLAEGTIRCFGISVRSPDDALYFMQHFPPACFQVNFNLTDLRALQNGLFELCARLKIGIIARTPLAFGFLTGQVDPNQAFPASDHRRRFSPEHRSRWADAVRLYNHVFDEGSACTPAQNALRFCLSFECLSTAIPGMMEPDQVKENLAAGNAALLDAHRISLIEDIYNGYFR